MQLTHQDIEDIVRLLDESPYDELNLQTGQLSLSLKRSADGGWQQQNRTIGLDRQPDQVLSDSKPEENTETPATEAGLLDIRAPMVGTFYRAPKPGATPFVDIGTQVSENSVIAIIEVMKLMSSIPAACKGEIAEILVDDARP